jgi:hypothetical protein
MNRLALSICVIGVALAGYTPVTLYANQGGQAPDLRTAPSRSAQSDTTTVSKLANPDAVSVAVWTPPRASFAAPLDESALVRTKPALPEAMYAEALPSAYEGDYDTPIWAVVTRGARLHAGPDVSSSTVWFYPVGAKLHLLGYRQGWFKVVDPETSRGGFIFAEHYLDALRSPTETPTIVARAPAPTETALAGPVQAGPAKLSVKLASRVTPAPYMLAPAQPQVTPVAMPAVRAPAAASRSESVEALLERALRR